MRKHWDSREPAALAWRGHAPDSDMLSWYDNPTQVEMLEGQRRDVPEGPSAWLIAPRVETVSNDQAEVLAAFEDYRQGRIKWADYQDRILALTQHSPVPKMELGR